MRATVTCLLAFFTMAINPLFSQTVQDAVVKITATVDLNEPMVTLTWENPAPSDLTILRRDEGSDVWYIYFQENPNTETTVDDPFVAVGGTYEYGIQRIINGIVAFGYITVKVEAPAVEDRGVMSLFVEEALETPLATELERLKLDLIGDGWRVVEHSVPPSATVASIKSQIVDDYNNVGYNTVFLFGEIPVPYSGNVAWDGHTNHQGAWPADAYYGDIQSANWTDNTVNTANNGTQPSRTETVNVPGDGKFDNNFVPTNSEIAVGRVDFSNLSETTFGTTRTELYRRYLDKNHNWRSKQYTVDNKVLVDDNFGYFGGEAFAANGYRNGYPLVGVNNVQAGDFFNDTDDGQSFLFAYGTGGGSYTSANGVGTSAQFASDTVNAVFVQLFGSYHGDWDYNPNPFMMSALASKGGILNCAWAGRPHWFTHPLGAGETIGNCALQTQNTCEIPGYFDSFGACGAHVSLLGDPSIRAQVVAPASNVVAAQICNGVELNWTASEQTDVVGYHVFRANVFNTQFYTRLTTSPVTSTIFTDDSPNIGDKFYFVKAVVREETPSGIFFNMSTGAPASINVVEVTPPTLDLPFEVSLNCNNPSYLLDPCQAPITCFATGPGVTSNTPVILTESGIYNVTATDPATGCVVEDFLLVFVNSVTPSNVTASVGAINCAAQSAQLMGNSTTPVVEYAWSGPNGFSSSMQNPTVTEPGDYLLTVTIPSNGCTSSASVTLAPFAVPDASATGGDITCASPTVQLMGSSTTQNVSYHWTGPNSFASDEQNPVVTSVGTYLLTVTSSNGCSATATASVMQQGDLPQANPMATGFLTCNVTQVAIMANPDMAGYTFAWTGPNGFTSAAQNPMVTQPGNYMVLVTNTGTGCAATYSITVIEMIPPTITIVIPDVVINCIITSTTVDLSAICGLPGITCKLNGQVVTGPVVNLELGNNLLEVFDNATGCLVGSDNIQVTEDISVPTLDITGDFDLPCADDVTTLTASSSTSSVMYWWTGLDGNPVQTVPPGSYTVTATALNGCETEQTVVVTAPPALTLEGAGSIDCDGSFTPTIVATGGVAPYTYTFSPQPPFPPGTNYEITVTDFNGCTASVSGTVSFPIPWEVGFTVTDETVAGANDGSATLSPSGGVPPYTYLWDNGQTTATATNLSPGVHNCSITDAAGCVFIVIVEIQAGLDATTDLPGLRRLALSPNPTNGKFELRLELENPLPVQVELLDVTGRILAKTKLENVLEKTWQFDLNNSPSGVYFCKIVAEGKVAVLKVVKME
ncbi:MAG: T9SS type A sorting domain-containing protein [Saprospiraceae bacterium]|nr:T9SS type A sorting domain-containing protein [Saprospiraceae bacterium]MCF8251038.1 T9SS type A sorting domain-containing protein [Saprospiraceae bacterium]MCF8281494.1 T9SS type A sorting domain-containing protein [Bacteroidales bacterium]MCF8311635.1 T9SS type A sorting domain-containing protein [Saprospiraceae bacterium]MCF8440976.1 T9SS type A sorting domain-containing protein [Saprospiraceae bacterium]